MKIIGILGEIFRGKSFYVADSGGVRNIRVLEFPGFQILMCEIGGGVKNGNMNAVSRGFSHGGQIIPGFNNIKVHAGNRSMFHSEVFCTVVIDMPLILEQRINGAYIAVFSSDNNLFDNSLAI